MDLKIGVLMGGDSAERKISLKSGEAIYKALKEKGCWVKKIVTSYQLPVTSYKTNTIKRNCALLFVRILAPYAAAKDAPKFDPPMLRAKKITSMVSRLYPIT